MLAVGGSIFCETHASVAFSCDVDFTVCQIECVDEVLPEPQELVSGVVRAIGSSFALRESCADWLIDPDHVRKPGPSPEVRDRLSCAGLPQEIAILLEQSNQTRTPRPAIEPDRDLVACFGVLGWREPEVQFLRVIRIGRNGKKSTIGLAYVERHIGEVVAIDDEFFGSFIEMG